MYYELRACQGFVIDVQKRSQALHETLRLIAYALFGQALGWILGPLLGFKPFSFHLAGTLVGGHSDLAVAEVWSWAIYNFGFYAVGHICGFKQSSQCNDLLVIVVIAIAESFFDLTSLSTSLNRLSFSQLALGLPLCCQHSALRAMAAQRQTQAIRFLHP